MRRGVLEHGAQALDLQLGELWVGQRLDVRLPHEAAGVVGHQTFGDVCAHRARTSSSVSSVTLSARDSMARSMSRTAKQMFWNEMLYR